MAKKIDREKLKKLFSAGLSDAEIAKALNANVDYICHIRNAELGLRRRGEKSKKILELWDKGMRKRSEIAYAVGSSPMFVYYVLLKNKRIKPKRRESGKTYVDMYEALLSGPKSTEELRSMGILTPSYFFKVLRQKGYEVFRTTVKRKKTVYFLPSSLSAMESIIARESPRRWGSFVRAFGKSILRRDAE